MILAVTLCLVLLRPAETSLITLYNVCAVLWGDHEYHGDTILCNLSTVGDIMIHVGDIMSTVGGVQ